jgi:hypothetical protein
MGMLSIKMLLFVLARIISFNNMRFDNLETNVDIECSVYIQGVRNFELVESRLRIEGSNTKKFNEILWTFETLLEARSNNVSAKECAFYRVTITKIGFKTHIEILTLKNIRKFSVMLKPS